MADIFDYDCYGTLPPIKFGKRRSETQQFRTSQPFAGPMYIEQITDESPVTWEVTFDCTNQIQAQQFKAFLRTESGDAGIKIKQGAPFYKCIQTEEGFIQHEVQFIEVPLTPIQTGPFQWQYSGVIYAVELIEENADICNDELIVARLQDASCIDTTMNSLWPE